MAETDKTRSLLLTGFGPFPGIPKNPSTTLVEALAERLSETPDLVLHRHVLTTEWDYVRHQAPALLQDSQPDMVVHFGLCRGTNGFRIERSAYNRTGKLKDAAGALPSQAAILACGAPRLDTSLSTARLARDLRQNGIPALPSLSAGRYLCNYLYYLSLDWAARQALSRDRAPLVLFVHIPPTKRDGGYLDEAGILRGADSILRHVLEGPNRAGRTIGEPRAA